MDIYAKPGTKVRYLGENGYDIDRKRIEDLGINTNQILTVRYVDVGGWSSRVYFEEYTGGFNTVCFEEVEDIPQPN